jgi:hypothetical protein
VTYLVEFVIGGQNATAAAAPKRGPNTQTAGWKVPRGMSIKIFVLNLFLFFKYIYGRQVFLASRLICYYYH